MVVAFEDLGAHEAIQIDQIADHAGLLIDRSTDGYFDGVVVTVSVGIIALAIGRAVFFLRHFVAMQAVRRRKHVSPGQVRLHASP